MIRCNRSACPSDVDEPFSKLTVIVNGMLDEMETMIHALAGVGNDIAHDSANTAAARRGWRWSAAAPTQPRWSSSRRL